MELKKVIVSEGPYSLFDVKIDDFRIGWFGFNGNKKAYGCHVSMFGKSWSGEASTPSEAVELIVGMVQMWLEELVDG